MQDAQVLRLICVSIFMCIFSNNSVREGYSHHIPLPLNTSVCVSESKELQCNFNEEKKNLQIPSTT